MDGPDNELLARLRAIFQDHLSRAAAPTGPTAENPPEYTFDTPAPQPVGPPAQVYADGGSVDIVGGYGSAKEDDYGYGRITRTPQERREARLRRLYEQPVIDDPVSPEIRNFLGSEYDRFSGQHRFNPLSYGMEAFSRLDRAAGAAREGEHGWTARDVWDNALSPDPQFRREHGYPGAVADALSIASFPASGPIGKAFGWGAPLLYGLGAGVTEALGFDDGGLVPFDPAGPGYDHATARLAGDMPDKEGHMASRDPVTGMQLKGRAHPTFDAAVEEDRKRGLGLEMRDGRYYTVPFDRGGKVVSKLIRDVGKKFGAYQASRVERAADETNLERITPQGLREMFEPMNPRLFVSMPPGDFQDYAPRIPQSAADLRPYPRSHNVPRSARIPDAEKSQDWYLDNIARLLERGKSYSAPELVIGKNLDDLTNVVEHEGRHRMMAMDRLGDPRSLVQLTPTARPYDLRQLDPEAQVEWLSERYFPRGGRTLVVPQDRARPRPIYSEPYAGGGAVKFVERAVKPAVKKLLDTIHQPDGGFTWQPFTGRQPDSGYAASVYPERSAVMSADELDADKLWRYQMRNYDLLRDQDRNYIGAWNDPATGQVYLDVSQVGPDLNEIAHNARAANQRAIFDLDNLTSIDVGGTGVGRRDPETYGPGFRDGGKVLKQAKRFLIDPLRESFPGIYQRPDKLVSDAREHMVPDPGKEGPMYRLFGHTRQSLDELSQGNRDLDSFQKFLREHPFTLSGESAISPQLLTNRNARRLTDMLAEAMDDPDLRATRSWYEMSPLYDRMSEIGTGDRAMRDLNTRMAVMSAGSDPRAEINRGIHANWLAGQGRLDDFVRYGGIRDDQRGRDFPADMRGVMGHAYHETAQLPNLLEYEATGRLFPAKHKVPTYVAATDPKNPYSERPIADSHFSRIVGVPDVSTASTEAVRQGTMPGTLYSQLVPWFNSKVAEQLDLRPRDAQALLWNLGGPQTGVRYIGPPKLEMIADYMDEAATRLGVSPETARDLILSGQSPGYAGGGLIKKLGPEFRKWFAGSKVVDDTGDPLMVYRGEHGPGAAPGLFQSRLGSLSFGDVDAANTYALSPNVSSDEPAASRLIPAYLKIKRPFYNFDYDDPFVDIQTLESHFGRREAERLAKKFSSQIENTGTWQEGLGEEFDSVAHLLRTKPELRDQLGFDIYHYLDDPDEIRRLRDVGFDGAIHGGMGETAMEREYRIFEPSQAWSPIARKPFARGGAVDDDLNLYMSQMYAGGGSVLPSEQGERVDDDLALYHSMTLGDGGQIPSPHSFSRRIRELNG